MNDNEEGAYEWVARRHRFKHPCDAHLTLGIIPPHHQRLHHLLEVTLTRLIQCRLAVVGLGPRIGSSYEQPAPSVEAREVVGGGGPDSLEALVVAPPGRVARADVHMLVWVQKTGRLEGDGAEKDGACAREVGHAQLDHSRVVLVGGAVECAVALLVRVIH